MHQPQILSQAKARRAELMQGPVEQAVGLRSTYDLLCRSARLQGDKVALRFLLTAEPGGPDIVWTYDELLAQVHRTANLLTGLGIGPTDAVGIMLPACVDYFAALWGAQAAGIAAPLNPMLRVEKLVDLLRAAGSGVLIAYAAEGDSDYASKTRRILQHLPDLKILTVAAIAEDTPSEIPGATDFATARRDCVADRLVSGRQIAPDDICAYLHTGGTTGAPKLARHTHFAQVFSAWSHSRLANLPECGRSIAAFPMYHTAGVLPNGLSFLYRCMELIIPTTLLMRNRAVVRNYWKLTQHHRTTGSTCAPTTLAALADVPLDGADISSLQSLRTGSAAIPAELCARFRDLFGLTILETYGMTEMTGISALVPPGLQVPPGCSGLVIPYGAFRIVELDQTDGQRARDLGSGQPGMILYKAPNVFAGYVGRDPGEDMTPDGWLITGDVGFLDADGLLHVTGRAKDLIIRSGHNIDPKTIEDAMSRHPDVVHAAAVGAPDAYAGELPVMFVTLRDGTQVTQAELLDFIRASVDEGPARPRSVTVLADMPLTNVGKIYKPNLRVLAARQVARDLVKETGVQADAPILDQITAEISKTGGIDLCLNGAEVPDAALTLLAQLPVRLIP